MQRENVSHNVYCPHCNILCNVSGDIDIGVSKIVCYHANCPSCMHDFVCRFVAVVNTHVDVPWSGYTIKGVLPCRVAACTCMPIDT